MNFRSCGLALALCFCCASAFAQETVSTGSISGRVTDPQGAVVPGATVLARQTETNVVRESVTDAGGRFRLSYLRVGPYEVVVRLQGFADARKSLTLSAGSAFEVPVTLTIATLDATVDVSTDASVLEAARTQIAGTVAQAEVQNLPMNGRNFLDIALLVPGVSPTNVNSAQVFPETSAVPGSGLSVGSQRNLSNNFMVDGLSANDDAAGLSGIPYGVDAVEQFQVVTSGGQAELGRALGGHVSVVTRSGTNRHRGDLYGYFRDDRLTAPNPISGRTLPLEQQQVGGSAGGPIRQDRSFFFTNLEWRNQEQSGLTTITQEHAAIINARLAATGYPGAGVQTGVFANPLESTTYLGKVDHVIARNNQIGLRYSLYDVDAHNARGAGGLSAPSASSNLDNLDQAFALSNVWTLSPRTVNETRAQVTHGHLAAPPSDPIGPAVAIAGVATFGTLSTSPTGRANTLVQVIDNLSHQAGAHALRAGVDVQFNADRIVFPRAVRGSYAFGSLAAFLAGAYNNAGFTQTFGEQAIAQRNPNLGIYAQDEWKLHPALTVNAGIRYDLQFLESIGTDRNNVSPRAGFAWAPSASRSTVIRGSAGVFYDRVPLRALANALLSANNTSDVSNLRQIAIALSPGQAAAPVFPAILAAPVPSVTLPNLTTMDRAMQNAHSRQAAVEVEQLLGTRTTISAGYQYTGGRQLIIAINQNVASCPAAAGNNGCRPDPTHANNSQYSPEARSSYHGLHLSFLQRPTRWGHYRVSYTLSKAMSNVGEFFFSAPIDPFDLSKDWGRSDNDQRHRLVMLGTADIEGFQLSGMVQRYSALPLNVTSGVTTVQGTAGRPIVDGAFIPRNAGVGPDFFSLNVRVARTFRLSERVRLHLVAEGFNLTNRMNVLTMNGTFGTGAYPSSPQPGFGQPTAAAEPRSLQLGVRLGW